MQATITQDRTTTPIAAPDLAPTQAPTCPSCESHNVTDTDLGVCGDCGLSDNLSAFMGGDMTNRASFAPSRFAKAGGSARSFESAPRAFTIRGDID